MIAVVGSAANEATADLVASWRSLGVDARLVGAEQLAGAGADDVVLGRLDIVSTLDGIEPGLLGLLLAERRGARVLNRAGALLAVHDKLKTAAILGRAGMPHPRTALVRGTERPAFPGPYVVKPRFGSWGLDVAWCADARALARHVESIRDRPWFRRHGALVQQEVPNRGYDYRLVVAHGRLVGAAERRAAPGEWRTNVSCGGALHPVDADVRVVELARTAAAIVGLDFVGVDVLPSADDGLVVLELNGAVEFDDDCAIRGRSVPAAAAAALGLLGDRDHALAMR